MIKNNNELTNHIIICGFGRNGKRAALELLYHNEKVIIIENEDKIIDEIKEYDRFLYVKGDATNEEVLMLASIESAKAIITTLPNDADNLFVVLTVRDLNEGLKIISRASEEHSDIKLRQAGADNIIMPDKLGGQQMAKLVTHPDTVEFINQVLTEQSKEVKLYEVVCENLEKCNIKTIGEFDFRNKTNANIIGIRTDEGNYIFNPSADLELNCDDKIFVLGTEEQVNSLRKLLFRGGK